ncbi:MAG TPA: biotin--[acetyl-CoA-carboxylase] ligase [Candidatus Limnocylindrales bacterium]|nr:biotin--[acetyl-CoA-carboxylase] ligase [Candidatus Limnocylindrales bacterium]
MTDAAPAAGAFFARVERYGSIGSTNDEVREWLMDATPEVCLAVADEQTDGRGRLGRTWTAPPGAALLCSLGFRPTWLEPDRTWRLAATVALAMCDAAEDSAGLPVGAIRLKWPNDLVIETGGPNALLMGDLTLEAAQARLAGPLVLHKLAGVLGETDGLGTESPRVVVGIGVNADWSREDFPPDIAHTMTSLREASAGRPIDRDALLEAFGTHLEARIATLRTGYFDIAAWTARQATTGRQVTLESGDGSSTEPLHALGVDGSTGALVLADDDVPGGERHVHAGEVARVRLAPAPAPALAPPPEV